MNKGFVILSIMLFSLNTQALSLPQYLNFDGQLLDSSDQPINSATTVIFEIYDPTGNCLLYKETQIITPDTYGEFSTKIGPAAGGTASASDGDIAWPTIFQNDNQVRTTDPTFCVGGYTPAAGHSRKLRVTIGTTVLTPDYTLAPVPSATVAETLQGKVPSDFLASAPSSGNAVLNANLQIENAQSLKLGNAAVPSANFVSIKALNSLAASYILTLPSDDGTNGQVLTTDGNGVLSWTTPSGGGGTITSVFGRTGVVVSSSGDYSASQITNTAAGSVSAVDVQSAINEIDAEKLNITGGTITGPLTISSPVNMATNKITNLGAPINTDDAATKQYVDSLSLNTFSCATDQVLQHDGTSWICGSVTGTSTSSLLTVGSIPSCTSNETLIKSAGPAYTFSCVAISIPAANVTSTLSIGQGGTGATTALSAFNALAPPQASHNGKFLMTDGTNTSWVPINGSTILSANGTSATPGLSFSGDTDTGFFSPAANTLAISTGGIERTRIDASGTINQNGNMILHQDNLNTNIFVKSYGSSFFPSITLFRGDGSQAAPGYVSAGQILGRILFGSYGNSSGSMIESKTAENHSSGFAGSDLLFSTVPIGSAAPAARLFIKHDGNVGIGTTTPNAKLEVDSASGPLLDIKAGGISKLFVTPTGVGVNTTSPQVTLDINGIMRLAPQSNTTGGPVSCTGNPGLVAYNSGISNICVCNGTSWKLSDGTTNCGIW